MSGGAILIILGIAVYLLPSFIAWNKKTGSGVVLLNIFLGWTIIGWIVALIWAVSLTEKYPGYNYICPKCGYKHALNQKVTIHVCPQCKHETLYEKA
jgi:hypothetical protein